MFIVNTCKGSEECLEDDPRPPRRNRHTDLFADTLLAPCEKIAVWKGLKPRPFSIRQGAGFSIMVDVCSTAAGTRHSVGRLVWIETLVNLADFSALDMKLQTLGKICCKRILPGANIPKPLDDPLILRRALIVRRVRWNRRLLYGRPRRVVAWSQRRWTRRIKRIRQILTNADDDNTMASLR